MELNATILIQAVVVLVLMAWLSPVLFGPLMKVFDERERRIHGAAEEAKRRAGSADEKTALVDQRTKEAQAEARQILTGLREEAQQAEKTMLAKAREQASERLDEARSELFTATEDARRALKDDAARLADQVVQKVLGRAA
jgi:F-type H+-transporting ATPase subunit b